MSSTLAVLALLVVAVRLQPRKRTRDTTMTTRPRAPRRRTHARRVSDSLPDAIDLVVLAIRAGYLPAEAMTAIATHVAPELRPTFQELTDAVRSGTRFADALALLPQRLGPQAAPLADSLIAADRYGLPLEPVLDRLADEARQHRRRNADVLARQLPVRLSLPLVLCTLPSFVLLAVVPLLIAALSSLHR